MKTILVINDQSPEAEHAVRVTIVLAQQIQANIILATTVISKKAEQDYGWIEDVTYDEIIESPIHVRSTKKLIGRKRVDSGFCPQIQEVELTDNKESLLFLAVRTDLYMVVKGMNEFLPEAISIVNSAIDTLLSKFRVPLLLIPSSWSKNEFTRLTYLTDLRFCCVKTAKFLAEFADKWKANLVISHTSASGLPPLEIEEAENIFNDAISPNLNFENLFLNIMDKNEKGNILQVMVDGMRADLLVLVNQHFHFTTVIKQYFKNRCSLYKPVPLLVFPS